MPKVLIADKMDAVAAEIFKSRGVDVETRTDLSPDQLAQIIGGYDGIAVRSTTKITAPILATPGVLKVIGRAGIGVDTVDVAAATRAGVVVMNTPFGNSVTTAEHTVAMMMALARSIPEANASTHAGKWEKSAFMGVELAGKTLGVVGCGNIGGIVARRALALEMKVMAFDPFLNDVRAAELGVTCAELDDVLRTADFITLHTPMTDKTRGLIDARAIAKMKKGVYLINCARGGLIVEKDLLEALNAGHVAGAALDVFETEPATENILFGHKNVICTPHLGASTREAQVNVAQQIAQQMSDYLLTGAIQNAVNMPAVSADEAPRLKPFLLLGDILGSFAGQIVTGALSSVLIDYQGDVAWMNTKPITLAVLAALLRPVSDSVNLVNAADLLAARGIHLRESTTKLCPVFDSAICVEFSVDTPAGPVQHRITGTLFANQSPRIVDIDGVNIEAAVTPHMILVRNTDKPGFIGALGTLLGRHAINIADFRLGRLGPGLDAVALVSIDTALSAGMLADIGTLPQIQSVQKLAF